MFPAAPLTIFMMYQSHCQLIDKWINTYVNESVTVLFSLLKELNEKQHREKWRVDYIIFYFFYNNKPGTDKHSAVSFIGSI